METLYRKYRPQTFADIVDQQHVKITLQQALIQDKLAHAYLFSGPKGVGKTTIARLLARAANCTKLGQEGEPCNTCPTCRTIIEGRSLDIIEIDAASQTGVDNVRENIIQSARSTPAHASYKVFIIDEVHMLSMAAFNALLKLLEEPPAHAMFILATTEVHRVPETIISRTQRFDFKKINVPDLIQRLRTLASQEHRQLEDGVAERIARFAGGSLRDAESMLGQIFSFPDKKISNDLADVVLPRSEVDVLQNLINALVRKQTTEALTTFHTFCNEGGDIPILLHALIRFARGVLFGAVDRTLAAEVLTDEDPAIVQSLITLSQESDVPSLISMVEELMLAERHLSQAVMMELPIEVAIMKITATSGPDGQVPSRPATIKPVSAPAQPPKPAPGKKTGAGRMKLNLESVQQAWRQAQQTLAQLQPSLALSMRSAQVTECQGEVITLAVPFRLHRDRLLEAKNYQLLLDELSGHLGANIQVHVTLVEADQSMPKPEAPATASPAVNTKSPSPSAPAELWDQVVASFGSSPVK